MIEQIYSRDLPGYEELTEKQKRYIGKNTCYDLTLVKGLTKREELSEFVSTRAAELKVVTFFHERKDYNLICRFLNEKAKTVKSLRDKEPEFWMRKLRAWMLAEGLKLTYDAKSVYGNVRPVKSRTLGYMERLLCFLNSEQPILEREKDIWNLEKLDIQIKENPVKKYETINFTGICQPLIREELKSGIYLNLQCESIATVQKEMTAMRRLSSYLKEQYPDLQSLKNFNRTVLEEYLTYLKTEKTTIRQFHTELNRLRAILECIGKVCNYEQMEGLLLTRDIPPIRKTELKDYSDAELKRLNVHIVKLHEQYARAMIIHQLLGTRISDTLTLETDCLYEKNDRTIIRIRQMKTKPYEKPVSSEVAALIRKAIQYTEERYGETKYIFVNEKDPSRPLLYTTIQSAVVRMIRREDLRDDNGVLFGFGSHLYRHTYGVKLAQMHLDDWTIAKLLGHSSVRNVKYYRRVNDDILADETREARRKMSELILANLDGWEEEYEQIRQNACLE